MREPQDRSSSAPDGHGWPYGHGLMLFRPGTPVRVRRGRWAFLIVYVLIGLSIIWPVYPRFAGPEPQVLGLPLFFAWVLGALLAVFVSLLVLYRAEPRDEDA